MITAGIPMEKAAETAGRRKGLRGSYSTIQCRNVVTAYAELEWSSG
jgi:hypothetical protein